MHVRDSSNHESRKCIILGYRILTHSVEGVNLTIIYQFLYVISSINIWRMMGPDIINFHTTDIIFSNVIIMFFFTARLKTVVYFYLKVTYYLCDYLALLSENWC